LVLPPAWGVYALAGGRLVAPVRIRTAEQSIAFRYDGKTMDADTAVACGFLPMRGIGASPDRSVLLSQDRPVTFVVEDITPILEANRCYERRDDAIRKVVPEFGPGWRCKIVLPQDRLDRSRR
jgi:hypothetical protein